MNSGKDWTGSDRKSIYATLGASNHSEYERVEHDYYATNPKAITELFKVHAFTDKIWEPACGEGHLSKEMERLGKQVYSTDLIDRNYGYGNVDFLNNDIDWNGDIITNPPYKYAKEFVEQAMLKLYDNRQLAMFLKLTFIESQSRRLMFDKYPPEYIYVFSKRMSVARNSDPAMFEASSAACYAWFIWRKGFNGEPTVRWI